MKISVRVQVGLFVCANIADEVCVRVCVCVCMYVCVSVYLYIKIYMCVLVDWLPRHCGGCMT